MEVEEIWKAMLYEINDIDVLKEACQNNEIANKICCEKSFWLMYFRKNNISLIDVNYDNANAWIEEFIFSKIKMKETDKLTNYTHRNPNSPIGFYYWIDVNSDYTFLTLKDKERNKMLKQYLNKNDGRRIKITVKFNGIDWILNYDGNLIFDLLLLDMKRYIFQVLYNNFIIYPVEQL